MDGLKAVLGRMYGQLRLHGQIGAYILKQTRSLLGWTVCPSALLRNELELAHTMLGDDVDPGSGVCGSRVLLDERPERALEVLRWRERDQQHAHELPAFEGTLTKIGV
jgi:hypothetical protein